MGVEACICVAGVAVNRLKPMRYCDVIAMERIAGCYLGKDKSFRNHKLVDWSLVKDARTHYE
jgi:hypothetical protein